MTTDQTQLKYDANFEHDAELRDGTQIVLRPIRPSDRTALLEGFERLSPESRYTRFLTPKQHLSEAEIKYLTDVDGYDHFAVGAGIVDSRGNETGVGIGRFVRLNDAPATAEPAIAVLDDYQGQGAGGLLLRCLQEAAWERGIRWFQSDLLAQNTAMKALLEEVSPEAQYEHAQDGVVRVVFPVPEPAEPEPTDEPSLAKRIGAIYTLLSHVARQHVSVSPRATRPPPEPK